MLARCRKMTKLRIKNYTTFADVEATILSRCHISGQLQVLSLQGSTISNAGLLSLASTCKSLTYLSLKSCARVSASAVVDILRNNPFLNTFVAPPNLSPEFLKLMDAANVELQVLKLGVSSTFTLQIPSLLIALANYADRHPHLKHIRVPSQFPKGLIFRRNIGTSNIRL
jgi:hypothetical protein